MWITSKIHFYNAARNWARWYETDHVAVEILYQLKNICLISISVCYPLNLLFHDQISESWCLFNKYSIYNLKLHNTGRHTVLNAPFLEACYVHTIYCKNVYMHLKVTHLNSGKLSCGIASVCNCLYKLSMGNVWFIENLFATLRKYWEYTFFPVLERILSFFSVEEFHTKYLV